MFRVVTLSGSLRAGSSNTALMDAARRMAPPALDIVAYDGIGRLPHFNADLEETGPPAEVAAFRAAVAGADALLASAPEYARGVPGAFKNALDWLVGDESFAGKPVVLWTASARAEAGPAALRLVLTTMSADIVAPACVTVDLMGGAWTGERIAADAAMAPALRAALDALAARLAGP